MKNYYQLLSKKLFSMYMSFILLFIFFAYSACYFFVQSNYEKSEQKRAEQLIFNFEDCLSYSTDIAYSLSTNQVIMEYAQSNVLDDYIYPRLSVELNSLKFTKDSYRQIAVVNVANKHVMFPDDSMSLDYFNQLYGSEDDTLNNALISLYERNENNVVLTALTKPSKEDSSSHLAICISSKSEYKKPVIFVFLYNLNEFFAKVPTGAIPCTIELSTKKNNLHILYNENDKTPISLSDADNLNYKKIVTSSTYSKFFKDISCSIYVPPTQYFLYINNFFILLPLSLLALLFIGIVYTRNRAKAMYTPIKKLLSVLPNEISASNNSEFDAFETYIFDLETQKNVMSEIISKNKKQLSDKFLTQLMTSTISKAQIRSGIINYGLNNIKFPVVTFIITYRNYTDLKEILSGDGLNEVRLSAHEYFDQSFANYKFFKLIDIDQQTIAGIASIDNFDEFFKQIKKVALGLEMLLDIDLVIFIGEKAGTWYEISDSYFSANNLKNKCIIIPDRNIIISAEEINDIAFSKIITYSPETENGLINSVMTGNKNASIEYIDEIIDTNMGDNILPKEHYSQLVIMLYSTITKLLTAINKTEKEVYGEVSVYLELMSCTEVTALKSKLTDFIYTLIYNIDSMQKNIEDNTTRLMLKYIDENFANDISLFTLADYLNISHPYASTVFKLKTGQNFKDYLTDFRLNKAIEFMKDNPMMKISDVAKAIGYSRQTFTRVFTKKFKIPPSNYLQNPEK